MRLLRLLPLLLGAALAAWVLTGGFGAHPEPTVEARAARRDEQLARFRDALVRWREGEPAAEGALAALADELVLAGRADARAVLDHYRALSVEARRDGLALERRYEELWARVEALHDEGLSTDEWRDERADVLHALDGLIADARGAVDVVPLARCLGLLARLHAERAEADADLRPDELQELLDAARDAARESNQLFERAGMATPRLEPFWVEARVERRAQNEELAEELAARCLDLARSVANTIYVRHALELQLDLAWDARDLGRVERIVRELAALGDEDEGDWTLVRRQADLLIARDQPVRAVELLQNHAPKATRDRFEWRQRLSSGLLRAKRFEEADTELADEGGARAPATALARAALLLAKGAHAEACATAEAVLATPGIDADEHRDALWIAGESALRLGRIDQAVHRLEARHGEEQWAQTRGMRRLDGTAVTTNALGERGGLHAVALLAEAYLRAGRALDAAAVIEASQTRLLRVLSDEGPARALEAADLAAWAARYEGGLVTWVVGADASVVAWVGPDGAACGATIARSRRSIEDAARRLREAVLLGDEPRADELALVLQMELFPAPILERLQGAPGRVLCLAHGPIERLALERLPLFTSGALAPACLPGLPAARPAIEPARLDAIEWSLLGAPVDAAGRELLPGARAELEALAALHPGASTAFGERFTRAALVDALVSERALHVATHLVHAERATSGRLAPIGLELARGEQLVADAVAALKPRVPFAFLSACETGEGEFVDAQGLQGLARALLDAGTRDLLVTLWPVQDQAARDFALAFHRELAQGLPPSECAAKARAGLRDAGWPSSEWAAFRALGAD